MTAERNFAAILVITLIVCVGGIFICSLIREYRRNQPPRAFNHRVGLAIWFYPRSGR